MPPEERFISLHAHPLGSCGHAWRWMRPLAADAGNERACKYCLNPVDGGGEHLRCTMGCSWDLCAGCAQARAFFPFAAKVLLVCCAAKQPRQVSAS